MVGPRNAQPYTFRALRNTFGKMWLRCDVCRRFAAFTLPPGYLDRDYRTVSFSCSVCGGVATHTVAHPHSEPGMGDYREDDVRERPQPIRPRPVYKGKRLANRQVRAALAEAQEGSTVKVARRNIEGREKIDWGTLLHLLCHVGIAFSGPCCGSPFRRERTDRARATYPE